MINYSLISDALEFYVNAGFSYVDVPWLVSQEVLEATIPDGASAQDNSLYGKFLVASAEQSFLQLMVDGRIFPGKYCAVTPCFRNEPEDWLHKKSFMKVELIHIIGPDDVALLSLHKMINLAKHFFMQYAFCSTIDIVEIPGHRCEINYDIMADGIELGSYGIRSYKNFRWIYATGIAEPRLSTVISF